MSNWEKGPIPKRNMMTLRLFNLDLNGVESVHAEIESNMDANIRASKLLTAGAKASHEANIALPQEQRAQLSRAEDNNSQYAHENYEHDMLG